MDSNNILPGKMSHESGSDPEVCAGQSEAHHRYDAEPHYDCRWRFVVDAQEKVRTVEHAEPVEHQQDDAVKKSRRHRSEKSFDRRDVVIPRE